MPPSLPQSVQALLTQLEEHGFEAYLVGGCVRDLLRGVTPNDFDVTTNALPSQTLQVFSDRPVLETGLQHGTVTVLWEHQPMEITTYRTDGNYTDGRHPDSVTFTPSLCEDLARRDFTVNAIAMDRHGRLCDPFGGQMDLQNRILRAVGDPQTRFSEDALRILRLWRFASVLDFTIDPATADAAVALAQTLQKVSAERIFTEFQKGLCGKALPPLLSHPLTDAVFSAIAPPLTNINGQAAQVIAALPQDRILRFGALCRCASLSEQQVTQLARAWKSDRAFEKETIAVLRQCALPLPRDRMACRRRLSEDKNAFLASLSLLAAFGEEVDAPQAHAQAILDAKECLSVADLAMNGNDLLQAGLAQGAQIGLLLRRALEGVLTEQVTNEKSALLSFLQA